MYKIKELTIMQEFSVLDTLIDGIVAQLIQGDGDSEARAMGLFYSWEHFTSRIAELLPDD